MARGVTSIGEDVDFISRLHCLFAGRGVSVAVFKHHTAPMTSVEWHPTDSSVFVASGADNQVTLWDLAVERDDRKEGPGKHLDVPPQLLFIHMVSGHACAVSVNRMEYLFVC